MRSKLIYFFRHGEDFGDTKKLFGSWTDPDITKKGKFTARKSAVKLKKKEIDFKIILSSPLKRAYNSAKIISRIWGIPLETDVYLKERNTYGLLAGLAKKEAEERYPDLIRAYNAQEFIPGSERYEDFKNRIDLLLQRLLEYRFDRIFCVTHGYVITTIMEEFLGLNRKEIGDGSYIGLKSQDNKFDIVDSSGISYSEGQRSYDSQRYRKFK